MPDSYFGESFDTPSVGSLLVLDKAAEMFGSEAFYGFFNEALNFCKVAKPEDLPKRYLGYAFIEAMKLSAACGGGSYFETADELDYELALQVPSGYGGLAFVAQYLLGWGAAEIMLDIYLDALHESLPDAMSAQEYEAYAEANYD